MKRSSRRLSRFAPYVALVVLLVVPLIVLVLGSGGGKETSANSKSGNQHPVAAKFRPDGTRVDRCTDQPCYEQALANMAYFDGPKKALDTLEDLRRSSSMIERGCHRIAHRIGAGAVVRYDGDTDRAFPAGTATCSSGYYHGLLERALADVTRRQQNLAGVARSLCAGRATRRTVSLAAQCVHGLGHGLMLSTGLNLPLALRVCDRLKSAGDAEICHSGAFMENLVSSYDFKSRYLRDDDPLYPCNAVKPRHKAGCYRLVTSRILQINGRDYRDAADRCLHEADKGWTLECFESLARDASGDTLTDPNGIYQICRLAERYGPFCVNAAIQDVTGVNADGKRGAELCNLLPARYQRSCFTALGGALGSTEPTIAGGRAKCLRLPNGFAPCMRGVRAAATVTPRLQRIVTPR